MTSKMILTAVLFAGMTFNSALSAQYNERPDLVGSGSAAVDASGRSIKNKRVRAIHTDNPALGGGTAQMVVEDPYLAYKLGRNLNFREFRSRDGVLAGGIGALAGPMPDGTTAKITAKNQLSCGGCHNLPFGNPGGGTSFHKDSAFGRQAPHYYGGGVLEMLALQVRAEILSQVDTDGNGWVSAAEAQAGPNRVLVDTSIGGSILQYGSPKLSSGSTGRPSLNNIIRVWYVDAAGQVVPGASQVDGITTVGYGLEVVIFGWGQGVGKSALNPTLRAFYWDPARAHSGLDTYDPSATEDVDGDGVSEPTLAGAIQFPATHRPSDAGATMDPLGFSRDDPDGDGHLNELSEGDLDLAEWYMLNAPRPAFNGTVGEYNQGVALLEQMKCTKCHVADWTIKAKDETYDGDRRFFDLDVSYNPSAKRLEGLLTPLYTKVGSSYVRDHDSFEVEGLFTDLRQHDMGPQLEEIDFGGYTNRVWRTAPLWGVGSGFPWGHDGQSYTLDDIIRRHGGEALQSFKLYLLAGKNKQDQLVNFLEKLVLFDEWSTPADIDGDGVIAGNYMVAGQDTGEEVFNAEWLFETPLQIQGPILVDGQVIQSYAGVNIDDAYGQLLPYRVDSDSDGWPDVWDASPFTAGYRDGIK